MAKTGRPNFDYTCQGTWRGAAHKFSIVGNTSGSALNATDAQTFLEGEQSPFAVTFGHFMSGTIDVIGSKYYNGTDSAPVYEANYDPGSAPANLHPDAAAFTTTTGSVLPLEVCCVLEARCGTSSTSKPVFLRKFLRGAPSEALQVSGTSAVWAFSDNAQIYAQACGNGSWYNSITYVSPKGAAADSSGWSAITYPGNHQVPRGRKKKASATSAAQSSLLSQLLQAIAGG